MVAICSQFAVQHKSAKYDPNGLGNWRRFITEPVSGSLTSQVRQHNGLNEITRVDSTPFEYDGVPGASNGNLANDGTLKYESDALNRLVKVYKTPSSQVIIATYSYDALNRRIRKVVENGGLPGDSALNGTTDCLYQGWRCIEDRNPLGGGGSTDTPTKHYIWGIYLDELIQITDVDQGLAYYPLQDLLYRTTALTDESGAIVEAYDYDAYGNTLIFGTAGTGGNWWADDATQTDVAFCQFLFTGQRFDPETGNYYCKMRYYSSQWGRYLTRDIESDGESRDADDGSSNHQDHRQKNLLTNHFTYADSGPVHSIDPLGEEPPFRPTFVPEGFDPVLSPVLDRRPIWWVDRRPVYSQLPNPNYRGGFFGELRWTDDPYAVGAPGGRGASDCEKNCIALFIGLGAVGTTGVVGGAPTVPKPFSLPGQSTGTSPISKYLSRKFPHRMPFKIWAPTWAVPWSMTNKLGRLMGRWVPILGTGLLVTDMCILIRCLENCDAD